MIPNTTDTALRDARTARVALITGASRGLGLALARRLAAAGWTLLLDARGPDDLAAARASLAATTTAHTFPGDVTDPAHRAALVEASRALGGLDLLVNNASSIGASPQPRLLDCTPDVLEAVYRVNLFAPLALIQAAAPILKPGATIVNISSDAAVEGYEGWGAYGSSKAALDQLSNILAAEHPEWRVLAVDPGDMRTDLHQQAFPGEDISDRPLPDEYAVPGLLALIEGDYPSARYQARAVLETADATAASGAAPQPGVHELRVALTVEDFTRAAAFYRDGLSLPIVKEWNDPEGRGLILDAGRATLELLDPPDSAHTDAIEAGEHVSGPVRLALEVPDVGAATAALAARGARVSHPAVHTSWGNYTQRVQAPDGMQLSLYQPESESESSS
jgi:NAD(P)-dependent dehydrogenase (short-subunit alcohol dehydrogenase family)